MKLYNLDHSPYSTRVRIQIAKGALPVAVEAPPVALRTQEYFERFPLGKIPVVELDDGSHLSDSWVIMEYLEATNPRGLSPAGALERAHMQTIARCADTCLGPSGIFPLFASVAAPQDAEDLLAALATELQRLERVLNSLGDCSQRSLHLGDIALAPHIAYALLLTPIFGQPDLLQDYPELGRWWVWVNEDTAVAAQLDVMLNAAKAFFAG